VNVVAGIADQRDSLGVSRHVGLLAAPVAIEQQLRRVVAAIQVRTTEMAVSVEALEVRPRAAEIDGDRVLGVAGQRGAIGSDVVCDELSEQRPAGRDLDRVRAAITTVTDTAGGSEREQRILLAHERWQLGKQPSVASGGSVNRRIDRAGGRQTVITAETARLMDIAVPKPLLARSDLRLAHRPGLMRPTWTVARGGRSSAGRSSRSGTRPSRRCGSRSR
jgi:hypothetical protein